MSKMRQLLMHASEQKNSKFYLGIILIATGDPASGGIGVRDYAKHWRVTPARVSQLCIEVCDYLGTKPSPAMRSEGSRDAFRKSNRRNI